MKYVEPACGKEYAEALVDASHLFSEEIPSNCEVSGVSTLQASVMTLIAAGSLLILGRL